MCFQRSRQFKGNRCGIHINFSSLTSSFSTKAAALGAPQLLCRLEMPLYPGGSSCVSSLFTPVQEQLSCWTLQGRKPLRWMHLWDMAKPCAAFYINYLRIMSSRIEHCSRTRHPAEGLHTTCPNKQRVPFTLFTRVREETKGRLVLAGGLPEALPSGESYICN